MSSYNNTTSTTSTSSDLSNKGAHDGSEAGQGIKSFNNKLEDARKGLNNFLDQSLTPDATKARDSGVTARHSDQTNADHTLLK